ncbi:MAG: ABC transporter substrate-binding protein [Carbonactinosporaceae bacterium]
MSTRLLKAHVGLGAGLLALALALAGCGGGGETAPEKQQGAEQKTPSVQADKALAARVPADIKSAGAIKIGIDLSYPPNEFVGEDGTTPVGWDVELGKAIAGKLGLTAQYTSAKFDAIIPGLQSGKFAMGLSSFTISPERAKVVDFVSYYSAGTSWAVPKGNPDNVSIDDPCGLKIGVQQGTVQQTDDLPVRQQKCKEQGKKPIQVVPRGQQTEVNADLVSGKVDAMLADSPIVGYAVQQTEGQVETLGQVYDTAPYGIAFQKGSKLAPVVRDAVQQLMDDGTYQKILKTWGAEDGAISTSELNPAS